MLENLNVLIIGGGKRYLQIIERFLANRMHVSLMGYQNIKDELNNVEYFNLLE